MASVLHGLGYTYRVIAMTQFSEIVLVVSRDEIERCDIAPVLESLLKLISSQESAIAYFEKVDIAVEGYDQTTQELFEIPTVRDFIHKLDEEFPFWLFFLNKSALGLQFVEYCFLLPFLTEEARRKEHPEQLDRLLTNRWFPAMNHICAWVQFSEQQIEALTNRSIEYLLRGPIHI